MRSETSVGRAVVIIVVAGAALGMAHNWLGLKGQPPHGIPWLAAEEALPNLESLLGRSGASAGQGATAGTASTPPAATPGPAGVGRAGAQPVAPPTGKPKPAAATGAVPHESHAGQGSPQSETPSAPAAPPANPATPPSGEGVVTAVPQVPDLDRPVQVELSTVKKFFDAGAALFLDARDPAEYEAGHIPGALRMTRDDALAEPESVRKLPAGGKPIIAYCEGGTCEASLDLARVLVEAGYRKVLVYGGGFPEWAAAGHPVERGGGSR